MDNNNLFDKDNQNQNNEQGQSQQQPYQPQQPYQQQPYQPQQSYQQPYQPQQPYQQQPYQPQQQYSQQDAGELEEPVSFADWMISMLISCIPCVGIVMIFVWAFGSNTKKSKSNYFKAVLVWTLISVALVIVPSIAFGAIFASMDYYY